jgi:hypothetical protein
MEKNTKSRVVYNIIMKNKTSKKISLLSLILGYLSSALFIALIIFNIKLDKSKGQQVLAEPIKDIIEKNSTKIIYIDRFVNGETDTPLKIWNDPSLINLPYGKVDSFISDGGYKTARVDNDYSHPRLERNARDSELGGIASYKKGKRGVHRSRGGTVIDDNIDTGLLDRRLASIDHDKELVTIEDNDLISRLRQEDIGLNQGGNDRINVGSFVPDVRRGDFDNEELGAVGNFDKNGAGFGKGTTPGVGQGSEVYAYNFPSQGVGAGIGSPAVGAAAGFAGLSAGIGQSVINGQAVPALGGVGSYIASQSPKTSELTPTFTSGATSGAAGLIGGAGAGAAAGLKSGRAQLPLKLGSGVGVGYGGGRGDFDFQHLPKDGALHIMIHVDGSGSILKTRGHLEVMKNTLLKTALLPYYNNDESLYSKRVTIVDGAGERTLKFFSKAAEKDNVLAFVFQDEAQPAYHLPNFNKKPEEVYKEDLGALKSELEKYKGLYRGVMFQVGEKVFSKSFKQFVENAWQGQGYLKDLNLKKYHWQDNTSNIKNKKGVVFIDEYNTKINGTPQYYLDLIFKASKKAGIDLSEYKAGLTDGEDVRK